MGWTHVLHWLPGNTSLVQELFVMLPFRNLFIGSYLEIAATEMALSTGAKRIEMLLHETDAIVGPPRNRSRRFGLSRGYEWRWKNYGGPRTVAVGHKKL
jgi:GNAT superfamily N-acetyltransferase